jgi:hypothetical protein
MSETDVGASGTTEGAIYDAAGNRIAGGRTKLEIEPLVRFAKGPPFLP